MERLWGLTLSLGVAWAVLGLIVVAEMPDHSLAMAWASLFYPAYYTVGSIVYHLRSA